MQEGAVLGTQMAVCGMEEAVSWEVSATRKTPQLAFLVLLSDFGGGDV